MKSLKDTIIKPLLSTVLLLFLFGGCMHNPLSLHMEAQGQEALSDDPRSYLPDIFGDFVALLGEKRPATDIEAFLENNSSSLTTLYRWEEKDETGESSQYEYSYLHWAAEAGWLYAVEKLVEMGALVDITTDQGITPLMLAARRGSWEVVQYLVRKGANVNAQDGEQSSVAHYAASNEDDDPRILELVIQHGGKAGAIDYLGLTILSVAAGNGLESIVAYILKQDWGKKLIGIATNKKNTPLHMAIIRGYQTVAEMLIEAGAPDAPNGRKKRPSDLIPRYCPAVKRRILADPPSHAGSANE